MLSSSQLANLVNKRYRRKDLIFTDWEISCTLQEVGQLFSAFVPRVFIAILLYYTYALIKLLIDTLFIVFATFPYTTPQPLKAEKNEVVLPVRNSRTLDLIWIAGLIGWFWQKNVLIRRICRVSTYHFVGLLILLYIRVILFIIRFRQKFSFSI